MANLRGIKLEGRWGAFATALVCTEMVVLEYCLDPLVEQVPFPDGFFGLERTWIFWGGFVATSILLGLLLAFVLVVGTGLLVARLRDWVLRNR